LIVEIGACACPDLQHVLPRLEQNHTELRTNCDSDLAAAASASGQLFTQRRQRQSQSQSCCEIETASCNRFLTSVDSWAAVRVEQSGCDSTLQMRLRGEERRAEQSRLESEHSIDTITGFITSHIPAPITSHLHAELIHTHTLPCRSRFTTPSLGLLRRSRACPSRRGPPMSSRGRSSSGSRRSSRWGTRGRWSWKVGGRRLRFPHRRERGFLLTWETDLWSLTDDLQCQTVSHSVSSQHSQC
jgi:hypothetical protein